MVLAKKISVGVVGATGFAATELMKLIAVHPKAELSVACSHSQAGKKLCQANQELAKTPMAGMKLLPFSPEELNSCDVVFLPIPHGEAVKIVPQLKTRVIDFTADHRLTNTYGLPELFSGSIARSRIIANPGCYATACILASYPLRRRASSITFNCISGYSGAGKNNPFDVQENIIAYKLSSHRHVPEIEKILGMPVSFTPHVANAFRGLMCTAHLRLGRKIPVKKIRDLYSKAYSGTLTSIVEGIPCTKEVAETPFCRIGGFEFDSAGNLVIISVIDNLLKGASSQAIENMNLMFGLPVSEGLLQGGKSF